MKREVHLHGDLATRFGGPFMFDADRLRYVFSALSTQLPGFRAAVADGEFRVLTRRGEREIEHDDSELDLGLGMSSQVHIIPVPVGSKNRGLGKVILGVAIAGAAFAFAPAAGLGKALPGLLGESFGLTYGNIFLTGVSMALSGVAQMLSPQPEVGDYSLRESPDQRPSYLFGGPVNSTEQGQAVPLVYGYGVRVGSIVVSSGIETVRIEGES